jgi:hypothetical protein
MADLEELLDLSDTQAVAIQTLHQGFLTKIDSVRSTGADRHAMGSAMRQLRDQTDREVIALLSDEQVEKYEALREKEKEQMRRRMEGRQGRRGQRPDEGGSR